MLSEWNESMKILLSLSLSGTLLFFLVFFVQGLGRNRLSRRWQYYIWLLVVLRFLVPFSAGGSLVGTLFHNVEERVGTERNTDAEQFTDAERNMDAEQFTGAERNTDEDRSMGTERLTGLDGNTEAASVGGYLFVVWAAAALVLLIRKITVYQSYLHFLRKGNEEVSDIEILNLLSEKAEEMKIRRPVGLYQNRFLASPMMTGFFRPQIMIPDVKRTKETLSYVFAHELVHYKYRDLFYKWLVQITLCIHWFNPFVYLLERQVSKNCELACDEEVIRAMGADERKKYGDTLLVFLQEEESCKSPLASLTLAEGAGQLIERLGAVMDYKEKSVKIILFTVLLTLGTAFCSSALGVYAGQKESIKEESPETEEGGQEKEDSASGDEWRKEVTEDAGHAYTERFYSYIQQGFYRAPYIIWAGWNMHEEWMQEKTVRVELTLEDGQSIPVYFRPEIRQYAADKAAAEVIARLADEIRADKSFSLNVDSLYIVNIIYLPPDEIEAYARKAYENDEIAEFSCVSAELTNEVIEDYCEKAYNEDRIAFFSLLIEEMSEDMRRDYCKRAYEEDRIDFFSVLADGLRQDEIDGMADEFFRNGDIDYLSITVSGLSEEKRRELMEKARREEENDVIYSILQNAE